MRAKLVIVLLFVALAAPIVTTSGGQAASSLDSIANALTFRNIGPFRTAAWITEIAVPETPLHDHLYTIYAATRSGGLWKTVNNGITWNPISDSVEVAAVGAVAIAPSNPKIVWMGTGDQANARSSYSGKGVFKSIDAGVSWQFAGLPDSHHIARIVIHPTNPDIVYVAAMGHLFSRNEERGVFRTRDGGKTWDRVLYVNDGVGAIDLVINRRAPNTLYAAMYEKHRMPWQLIEGGAGTGIYRTDDGGGAWRKLEGGLPTGTLGRIGLDLHQRNPNVLYAVIENLNPRPEGVAAGTDGTAPAAGRGGGRGGGGGPIGNEVYRTNDGGKTWVKTHGYEINVAGGKAPYSFNQLRVNPANPEHIIVTSDRMYVSEDGGKTWHSRFFNGVFGDFRCMWWDAENPQRIMLGSDGGVNVSYDGGLTADYFPNMRVGEVYAIGVDMDDPYNVYAGLQDHDSWKGPSNSRTGRITLEQWTTVGPGDGMYNQVDPTDSRWVYNTREMGNHGRYDQLTGQRTVIAPPTEGGPRLRYNWVAPIVLSPHNSQIIYAGSQFVFRSLNRGDAWQRISPDLTTNETGRCGVNQGNVPYCTITTISESPVAAGTIWVGTDDGRAHVTTDHGATWTDVTPALTTAGALADRYVSRAFASPHAATTAFIAKSGFRNDDFRPFLYRTTDTGKTWTSVSGNLPNSPINVVVQDRRNPDLLIAGNDIGVFFTVDGGSRWSRIKANLPTVAVHDLTIHSREQDLVVGTYGRGIFVGDMSPLQDLAAATLAKPLHVFDIKPRTRYGFGAIGNYHLYGDKYIEIPNEPEAIVIQYWLKDAAANVRVTVTTPQGAPVAQMTGPGQPGLHRVQWNMRSSPPPAEGAGAGGRGAGRAGGAGRGGAFGGQPAPAGEYLITVEAGSERVTKTGVIRERLR